MRSRTALARRLAALVLRWLRTRDRRRPSRERSDPLHQSMSEHAGQARVCAATPQETVEEIVGKLWHCEQRRTDEGTVADLEARAEQPFAVVPERAVPHQLFDVCDQPERREEDDQAAALREQARGGAVRRF